MTLEAAMSSDPTLFAAGLLGIRRGDDDAVSDAAAGVLAETLLMHRAWLLAHVKK